MATMDYYEFLQISPRADQETIHRVYRYLGARFHPDNPDSGNAEKFSLLKNAYEVLSKPARRAEYDAVCEKESSQKAPLSTSIDFMDTTEGETNRRLALLVVLYFRRRACPVFPEVSLAEIEKRMGFPRDYLDFTTWYLKQKGYITVADNSDFALTAQGVDFVETQRASIPVLNNLLTSNSVTPADGSAPVVLELEAPHTSGADIPPDRRLSSRDRRGTTRDRRVSVEDRRRNAADLRETPIERRMNVRDRRTNSAIMPQDTASSGEQHLNPGDRRRPVRDRRPNLTDRRA